MRFFSISLAIFSGCSTALAIVNHRPTSTLASRDLPPLNPPESTIINHKLASRAPAPQSNAKRLAAGLPPLPPAKRWSERKADRAVLPRTSSSACKPGFIRVNNGTTILGYLSLVLNQFGEYSNVVSATSDSNALKVCVLPASSVSGYSDIKEVNPMVSSLPFLGIFQGFYSDATLSATAPAYVFFGQVATTVPGAVPSAPKTSSAGTQTSFGIATDIYEGYESNVWRVDSSTGEMQLWWTNPDHTTVQISTLYVAPDNLFAGSGDPDLFAQTYSRTVTPITFYYVSS